MAISDYSLTAPERPATGDEVFPTEMRTLREELRENYLATKNFLTTLVDPEKHVDPTKIGAIINSMSAILRDLVKLDAEVYNQERVQLIEQTVFDSMLEMPDETKHKFLELYRARLTDAGQTS